MTDEQTVMLEIKVTDESMARLKALVAPKIEGLEDVVCWLAQALVESESTIIMASRMGKKHCRDFLRRAMPIVIGIDETKLICGLAKHSPDMIPMKLLESILAEKEEL